MLSRPRRLLYSICWMADFGAFLVVFTVTRELAERHASQVLLGAIGAGLSLSMAVGSALGGWLSHRLNGRYLMFAGALMALASMTACFTLDPSTVLYLPGYWLLGLGLGTLYPPLIGWLNRGEDADTNRSGVSRTLILFCLAWNLGMMSGQLAGGWLFRLGLQGPMLAAMSAGVINLGLTLWAGRALPSDVAAARQVAHVPRRIPLATAFKRLGWIANLGGMFGGSMVLHLLPHLAVTIGVPSQEHGSLLAGWRVVVIGTYLVMHHLQFWHCRLSTSITSQLLAAAGLVVISQATSSAMLFWGLALLGQLVGYNYFSGLYYSTAGSADEARGLAAGIHEATLAVGMAAGTVIGGAVGHWIGPRVPYLLAAAVMIVLATIQVIAYQVWVSPLRNAAGAEVPGAEIRGTEVHAG